VVLPEEESVGLAADASDAAGVSLGRPAARLFEFSAGAVCLTLLAPIFLFAFIAIKFNSRGPIFIRQTRYGHRNRMIQVRKFRVTTVDSSPRSTLIGLLLKRTGIEELPMLINVLTGEMSVIGPPPSAHPAALLNERRPGITRWAEIFKSQNHASD
jgi:lipopolysaccharide/colanic/teichoic acid biosynthesis glycosyltransferase